MKHITYRKGVAVAVIILFVGLAFAPSINANISKASAEGELVEFTTEVCGLNGGKYTVKLTREEAEEVEALFDSVREQLNATESREEAETIFKEAVLELDKYGLLGGLSVKQTQRLITGNNTKFGESKIIKQFLEKNLAFDEKHNYLCLTAGIAQLSAFIGPPFSTLYYLFKLSGLSLAEFIDGLVDQMGIFSLILLLATLFLSQIIPWNIMNTFFIDDFGFLFTLGLNGIKIWNDESALGTGFTGIKIFIPSASAIAPIWYHYFIGYSLIVQNGNW